MNILPLVEALPYPVAGNIFMTGESRGAIDAYARALKLSTGPTELERITGIIRILKAEAGR